MSRYYGGFPFRYVGPQFGSNVVTASVSSQNFTLWESLAQLRTNIDNLIEWINGFGEEYEAERAELTAAFNELKTLVESWDGRIETLEAEVASWEDKLNERLYGIVANLVEYIHQLFDDFKRDVNLYVYDYVSGQTETLDTTLHHYWDALRVHGFTAVEFDAQGFTVGEIESGDFTVTELETFGKLLFPRTRDDYSYSPFSGKLTKHKHMIGEIHNLLTAVTAPTTEWDITAGNAETVDVF